MTSPRHSFASTAANILLIDTPPSTASPILSTRPSFSTQSTHSTHSNKSHHQRQASLTRIHADVTDSEQSDSEVKDQVSTTFVSPKRRLSDLLQLMEDNVDPSVIDAMNERYRTQRIEQQQQQIQQLQQQLSHLTQQHNRNIHSNHKHQRSKSFTLQSLNIPPLKLHQVSIGTATDNTVLPSPPTTNSSVSMMKMFSTPKGPNSILTTTRSFETGNNQSNNISNDSSPSIQLNKRLFNSASQDERQERRWCNSRLWQHSTISSRTKLTNANETTQQHGSLHNTTDEVSQAVEIKQFELRRRD